MTNEYIVIGSKKEGEVADHASDIETIVRAYKDGSIEESEYRPSSSNPGQEVLQHVDDFHSDAKAIITRKLQGPKNYRERAIINETETSVAKVVENYQNGHYDGRILEHERSIDSDVRESYGEPKKDGSGKGSRDNKGRNPDCDPEDYEPIGRGSDTEEGRAAKGEPKRSGYDTDDNENYIWTDETEDDEEEESSQREAA